MKLTKSKLNKLIASRNRRFNAAPKCKKRVMLARDVLAALDARHIIANRGSWVRPIPSTAGADDSLQACSLNGTVRCRCCGIGALMLSAVRFTNKVTVGDAEAALDYCNITRYRLKDIPGIKSIFSGKQLTLIEIAFEKGEGFYTPVLNIDCDAADFGLDYTDEDARLRAIMKNIIKNKGTFKPTKQ